MRVSGPEDPLDDFFAVAGLQPQAPQRVERLPEVADSLDDFWEGYVPRPAPRVEVGPVQPLERRHFECFETTKSAEIARKLETVGPFHWQQAQDERTLSQAWASLAPGVVPGLYLLYLDGVPVYVGSTIDLKRRLLAEHAKSLSSVQLLPRMTFRFLCASDKMTAEYMEKRFEHDLSPAWNQLTGFGRKPTSCKYYDNHTISWWDAVYGQAVNGRHNSSNPKPGYESWEAMHVEGVRLVETVYIPETLRRLSKLLEGS